jgi:uncharacterized protein
MIKRLLIVFVKNIKLGKVKTRLAKTIGDEGAFEVYKELVEITENATSKIEFDKIIYFSDTIVETKWEKIEKRIQFGVDLGARMKNAFSDGFKQGYDSIVLIGSDLPDISNTIIESGFDELEKSDVVFGPAEDGGYYLIGMNQLFSEIFKNKPWSQSNLLKVTLEELKTDNINFSLTETLNDIDTFEDLITSNFYKNNSELQQKIKQIHD